MKKLMVKEFNKSPRQQNGIDIETPVCLYSMAKFFPLDCASKNKGIKYSQLLT
jgi:hypothetical protein